MPLPRKPISIPQDEIKQEERRPAPQRLKSPETPQKSEHNRTHTEPEKTRQTRPERREKARKQPEIPEGFVKDEKTGKIYKELPKNSPDAIKEFVKTPRKSYTIDQMFKSVELDKDMDAIDLNKSANLFLAHLRVPPDPEEKKKLREEYAQKVREAQRQYEETQAILAEKDQETIEEEKPRKSRRKK